MKIKLNKYFNELEFETFNIVYGGNGSGKTELFKQLSNGFSGLLKEEFHVNGSVVIKNQYKVLEIGEIDSFAEELKLGSKSYLKKTIEKRIEDLLDEELEILQKSLEENVKSKFLSQIEYLHEIDLDFKLNLSELVIKNIIFKTQSKFSNSFSKLRKLQIEMFLHQEVDENTIFLIDHFDMGLSNYERNLLLDKFKKISDSKKCIFVLFTSNFVDFDYNSKFIIDRYLYRNVFDILSEEKLIDISTSDQYLFTEEEIEVMKLKKINMKFKEIKESIEKNQKNIEI